MTGLEIGLLAAGGYLVVTSATKGKVGKNKANPSAGNPATQSATGTNQPGVASDIGQGVGAGLGSLLKQLFGSGGGKSPGGGAPSGGGFGMGGGGGGGGGYPVAAGMAPQGTFSGYGDTNDFARWFKSEESGQGGFQLSPGGNQYQQPLNVEQIGQGSGFTLEPMTNSSTDTFGTSLSGQSEQAAPFNLSLDGGNSSQNDPFGLNLGLNDNLDTAGDGTDTYTDYGPPLPEGF